MTITIIAPPQADAAAPAPGNRPGVAHIDPNMKLVTGTFCSASETGSRNRWSAACA